MFYQQRASKDMEAAMRGHERPEAEGEAPPEKPRPGEGLRAPQGYQRAFKEITRRLHLDGKLKGKNVLVLHSKENVAAQEAFSDAEVKTFEKTYGMAGRLARQGYDAEKHDVESFVGTNADIVILLDDEVDITRQILRNVKRDGYFICLPSAASKALRAKEGFKFEGMVSMLGTGPDFEKSTKASGSVETDEELQGADTDNGEFVSFEEAADIVAKAGLKAKGVAAGYTTLLEEAGDDLEYKMSDGSLLPLKLLPPKIERGDFWVLKKPNR